MAPARVRRRHPGKRRGVAPIVAEMLLIAITLTVAASLSTYAFGIFDAYSSPALVSIQADTVQCVAPGSSLTMALPDGTAIPPGYCGMVVQNSGSTRGAVNGAGPVGVFSAAGPSGYAVPAGGHVDVLVRSTATAGSTVTGYLVQSNGPSLFFRAMVR